MKKPLAFSNRRIAVRRLPKQPTLESELRRVLRETVLSDSEINPFPPRRIDWQVSIEVSDYVETGPTTGGGNPAGDPYFNSVVLLMHFEGANNAVSFPDVKGHNFSLNGSPRISTAQKQFGESSAFFDGAGTISTPDSEDWNFGAEDFTIEGWVYRTGLEEFAGSIISHWDIGGSSNNGWIFFCEPSTAFLAFNISTTGPNEISVSSGVAVPINQWCHVAVSRQTGTLRFFINGNQVGPSIARPEAFFNSTRPLTIGGISGSSNIGAEWQGYVDELRMTKGAARYTSNFAIPTTPFLDY